MVCACIEMRLDASDNSVHASPRDDGVDNAVFLIHDFVIFESESLQVVHIVRQTCVCGHVLTSNRACLLRICFQNHCLFGSKQRTSTHHFASHHRVFHRNEIRMRTCATLGRQLQHLRTKSCENALWFGRWLCAEVNTRIHGVKVLHHCRIWLVICPFMHTRHHRCMTHAHAKKEPIRKCLGQCFPSGLHGLCSACMNARDTGPDHHLLCG